MNNVYYIYLLHNSSPFLSWFKIIISFSFFQIASAWKPVVKRMGLWKSIRSIARLYDAGMGMLIFIPIAFLSWFPFVSTFQTRLMFNQAFSRGLEISLILAGNNPNIGIWWTGLILKESFVFRIVSVWSYYISVIAANQLGYILATWIAM